MHPVTLDLPRLEQLLLSQDDARYYLDLDNGEVLSLATGQPEPGSEEKYRVQEDRYLALEPLTRDERLALRQDFLANLHEPAAYALLSQALQARKPLRSFDYQLENLPGVRQAWLAYQGQRIREHLLQWLQLNGLEAMPRADRGVARRLDRLGL